MESTSTNAPRKLAIKLRARSKTMASEASKEAVPARSMTPDENETCKESVPARPVTPDNGPLFRPDCNETCKESVPARPVTPDNGPLFRPDWRNPLDAPSPGSRSEAVYSNPVWTEDDRSFLWSVSELYRNDPTKTPEPEHTRSGYPSLKAIRRVAKATPALYNEAHPESSWPHDRQATTDMLNVLYRKEMRGHRPVFGRLPPVASLPAAVTRAARGHNELAQAQQNYMTAPARIPVMASLTPHQMDLDSPVDDHQSSWSLRNAQGINPLGLSRAPYRPLPFNSMGGGRGVQQAASSSAVHGNANVASSGAAVKRLGSPFEVRSYGPKTSGVERAQPPVREANSLPAFAGARLPLRTEAQDFAGESSVRQPRPVPALRPRLRKDMFLSEPVVPEIDPFFFVGRAELGARHNSLGSHTDSAQHVSDPFTSPGNSSQRGQGTNDSADVPDSRDTPRSDTPKLSANICTEFLIVTPNPVRPPPMPRRTCDYGPCDDDENFWISPPTVGISAFMERLMAPTAAQREVDAMRNGMREEEMREAEEHGAEEAPSLRINGRLLLMGTGDFALDEGCNLEGV